MSTTEVGYGDDYGLEEYTSETPFDDGVMITTSYGGRLVMRTEKRKEGGFPNEKSD